MGNPELNTRSAEAKEAARPSPADDLKLNVYANIRSRAEELFSDNEIKNKLDLSAINNFAEKHSKENYKNYREWNEDFCKTVLDIEDANAVEKMARIMALQLFLNKMVKGFSPQMGKIDSIDGKLGPFTLNKLNEYIASLKKPSPQAHPQITETQNTEAPSDNVTRGAMSNLSDNLRFQKDEIRYAGDSYMVGTIGKQIDRRNGRALSSSHFAKTSKFDKPSYRKNHIFIEEEADRLIDDPNCKLLVLNGGINDLYARGHSEQVINEIISAYTKIIHKAKSKNVRVAIYNINTDVTPKGRSRDVIDGVKKAAQKINDWLAKKSGADIVFDTSAIVNGRFKRDGLHPTYLAYEDLYNKIPILT